MPASAVGRGALRGRIRNELVGLPVRSGARTPIAPSRRGGHSRVVGPYRTVSLAPGGTVVLRIARLYPRPSGLLGLCLVGLCLAGLCLVGLCLVGSVLVAPTLLGPLLVGPRLIAPRFLAA